MYSYKVPTYFAALNTSKGFVSYFKDIFAQCKDLYIVKGGPGTGKSRFMRSVSQAAQNIGYSVEEYLCSSDPGSLDGLLIKDIDVAIIDGTAPHVYEPTLIGSKEHLVDLSAFLDSNLLKSHDRELQSLVFAKSVRYSNVYSYLSMIRTIDDLICASLDRAYLLQKLKSSVQKHARMLKKGSNSSTRIKLGSAISCNGIKKLDISVGEARKRYVLRGYDIINLRYLDELYKLTKSIGANVEISYDPIYPEYPDALYYPDVKVLFYCSDTISENEIPINTKRFVNDECLRPFKPEIRRLRKIRKSLFAQLEYDFKSISKLHAAIEEIYSLAMDFSAKEELTERFIKSVL